MSSTRQRFGAFVVLILLCPLFWHLKTVLYAATAPSLPDMSVTHIVLFQFKPSADTEAVSAACDRMLALKDNCIHPLSQQPYIKTSSGGLDHSIEGLQNGITHAFVVEFANKEDRDYYVQKDPAHQDFIKSLDGIIEKAQVIDFTDRVF
ncbi:hypothetical protein PISL3812_02166 [Talaromyces islandicus]|uniref:Stress-response A/B barrel domain-containing protein n=1 Tax=Talaromyces islandicus TaxID=28573 RepID=A0A0U1LP60_TALIS|nr:hypothetical protein PISL3812_02166 [Talaromyces islandicus]